MAKRPVDKPAIRAHMKRFKVLASMRTNPHISFLHIHCQFSLDEISRVTGISRKTTGRILMGQLPTLKQLRILQRVVYTATIELEKLLTYERASRSGMYYGEIIRHIAHQGHVLSRYTKENTKGRIRE